MSQTLSVIIVGSLSVLLVYVLFVLGKIILVGTTIYRNRETCEEPLELWLWGMMTLDCVNLPLAVRTLFRTYYSDERDSPYWINRLETWHRM